MGTVSIAGPVTVTNSSIETGQHFGFNTTDKSIQAHLTAADWNYSVVMRRHLLTDATVTGTTLGTITGLALPIAANKRYAVNHSVYYSTAGTTSTNFDLLQTTFTSTQTSVLRKMQLSLTTENIAARTGTTTLGTALASQTVTVSTNMLCRFEAFIVSAATPGTLNIQMATTAAQIITARAGSYVEWTVMPG